MAAYAGVTASIRQTKTCPAGKVVGLQEREGVEELSLTYPC